MKDGIPAVLALKTLSADPTNPAALAQFRAHEQDMGYALLLERYAPDLTAVTPADYQRAARAVIPDVPVIFWSFRVMVLAGFVMLLYLGIATFCSMNNKVQERRWLLKIAPWLIPLPYIACEAGWLVAEMGRQPWTVYGVLPTWMSVSTQSVGYMVFSLAGFVLIYTAFIAVEAYLMLKFIRKGPDEGAAPAH